MRRFAVSVVRALSIAVLGVGIVLAGRPTRLGAQEAPPASFERRVRAGQGVDSGGAFERGVARVVQRQLALTDGQLTRLQTVDRRFRQQRLQNQRQEVQTRRAIRRALAPDASPGDAAPLDTLLDRLLSVQADRVQLLRSEQTELRQFLSPVQRARYVGIQEFMRRRAEALRDGAAGDNGANSVPRNLRRRLRP